MTPTLLQLIGQARAFANDHPCKSFGHQWDNDGGRACRRSDDAGGDCDGSQPVLVCARCGEIDYGYAGGPADCDSGACGTSQPHCYTTPRRAFPDARCLVDRSPDLQVDKSADLQRGAA